MKTSPSDTEKQAVGHQHGLSTLDIGRPMACSLPSSVYDLPFDVCRRRKELDQEVTSSFGKLKGKFGIESKARDASLAETFRQQRELVGPSIAV
jgi:hypothetical protein